MRNLNFSKRNHMISPKAFVFLNKIIFSQCLASSASALWFLSGSQCPPTWLRIALGFAEIVFRRKTQWILHFSAQNRPTRMFFRLFSSFCSAFPCEILIFPNEITCFHYKPLFSSAKSYFLNAWLLLPQPYGSFCLSPMVPKWIPMSGGLIAYSFGFR